jgi:DNA polymerase delta subunit 1
MSSPTKRSPASLAPGSVPEEADLQSMAPPIKRLRGGGDVDTMDNCYPEPDEEEMMDEQPAPPEEIEAAHEDETVFSDITEEMRQRWLRPENQVKDNSQDVSLQWFDMDMIGGGPLEQHPSELVENRRRVVGSSTGQVPIVRAYGVTDQGNSVSVFIHGFTPYCYFALPANATFDNTEENLAKIRASLDNRLEGAARGSKLPEYCRSVSYVTSYKSIMGFESPHTHFFKVRVAMPTLIPALKRIMEEGMDLAGVSAADNIYSPFECNVPFVLRYMIDQDISGAGWLTLPAKSYQVRDPSRKQTHCQVR